MEEVLETLDLIRKDFENRTFRFNEPIFVIMIDSDYEYGYENGKKSFEYSNDAEFKEKFINDISNSKYFQDEFEFNDLNAIEICSENEEFATLHLSYRIFMNGELFIMDNDVMYYEY